GSSSEGSTESSDTETTITVQDPQSAYTTTSLGLVGDSQSLVLHISCPLRDLSYAPPESAASLTARTSDLLSVSYFMAMPGGEGLSGAVAAIQASAVTDPTQRVTASRSPSGLARLVGDQMAIDRADEEMDEAALAGAARVIAPEIASLSFRYFDGA